MTRQRKSEETYCNCVNFKWAVDSKTDINQIGVQIIKSLSRIEVLQSSNNISVIVEVLESVNNISVIVEVLESVNNILTEILYDNGGSRGGSGGLFEPPLEPKLFHFIGNFRKNWSNCTNRTPSANLNTWSKNPGSTPASYHPISS